MRSIEVSSNSTTYLEDGSSIIVNVIDIRAGRKKPGSVARHEGKHAFVGAEKVKKATIVPGPGYLGMVELSSFDAAAAAASYDEDGNGHDMHIIEASGQSVGGAISAASASGATTTGSSSSINILLSFELLILTMLFGLFANLIYFLFKKSVVKYINIYLNQLGA